MAAGDILLPTCAGACTCASGACITHIASSNTENDTPPLIYSITAQPTVQLNDPSGCCGGPIWYADLNTSTGTPYIAINYGPSAGGLISWTYTISFGGTIVDTETGTANFAAAGGSTQFILTSPNWILSGTWKWTYSGTFSLTNTIVQTITISAAFLSTAPAWPNAVWYSCPPPVCVNLTSTAPAFPSGPLTFTTTSTGPVTPPTCVPIVSVLSVYDNSHGGFPATPVMQFANTNSTVFAFTWTLNVKYNGATILADSGSYTTAGTFFDRMPLSSILWLTDTNPTGLFYHQWYFSNSTATPVASAPLVITFTMSANPASTFHFYANSWFDIDFWTT